MGKHAAGIADEGCRKMKIKYSKITLQIVKLDVE
jgi:hypothetical protein